MAWTTWGSNPDGGEIFRAHPGGHPALCAVSTDSLVGLKLPERGSYHVPHLSPRLKKEWSYTSTPLIDLGLF